MKLLGFEPGIGGEPVAVFQEDETAFYLPNRSRIRLAEAALRARIKNLNDPSVSGMRSVDTSAEESALAQIEHFRERGITDLTPFLPPPEAS